MNYIISFFIVATLLAALWPKPKRMNQKKLAEKIMTYKLEDYPLFYEYEPVFKLRRRK